MLAGLWLTALLTVVLQGSALDPSSLETAVASCDEVLAGRCLAEADQDPDESAPGAGFYVHLEADPTLSTVRLEVRRGGAGTLSLARTLAFEETATREERARTIGLVAAAHVLDVTRREEAEAAAAAAASVAEPTVASASERVFSLDLATFGGAALDAGPLRGGLMLRGAMRARSLPLGLLISARGAYRPAQPRIWWAGATLGVFARQELKRAGVSAARWALEARLEAVTQHTEATARQDGAREHSGTWQYGGQLGTELFVRLARSSWLFFGAEGSLLRPRVDVRLRGRVVGSEPPGSWSLLLGARTSW